MIRIYASWYKDIEKDNNTLNMLKESNYLSGIEGYSFSVDEIENLQEQGIFISIHNPTIKVLNCDLSDNLFIEKLFLTQEGKILLKKMSVSKVNFLGFHTYSKGPLIIDSYFPNPKKAKEEMVLNEDELLINIVTNLLELERYFSNYNKKILFEISPMQEYLSVDKTEETTKKNKIIMRLNSRMNDLDFINKIILHEKIAYNDNIGFLFDVSHHYCSYKLKKSLGEINISLEDYFDKLIRMTRGKVVQLHINSPSLNEKGIIDTHSTIDFDSDTGKDILMIAGKVIENNPLLQAITLEMYTKQDTAIKHIEIIIKQSERLVKELQLEDKIIK